MTFGEGSELVVQANIDELQNTRSQPHLGPSSHVLLYSEENLVSGNHTLVFTIQKFDNASIDYILYKPSFQTLQDKPPFPKPSNISNTDAAASSMSKTGAISGGAVGGVMICVLVILGLWSWKRRQRKTQEAQAKVQEPYVQTSMHPIGMNFKYF
jgi:hypothetical protein